MHAEHLGAATKCLSVLPSTSLHAALFGVVFSCTPQHWSFLKLFQVPPLLHAPSDNLQVCPLAPYTRLWHSITSATISISPHMSLEKWHSCQESVLSPLLVWVVQILCQMSTVMSPGSVHCHTGAHTGNRADQRVWETRKAPVRAAITGAKR